MLIYSIGVSVDGFTADADGDFSWGAPTDELFRFHIEQVGALGTHLLGRRMYETMRVWETDPALRDTDAHAEFADIWTALPKVVFSTTLDRVDGNARLAEGSIAEEVAAALAIGDGDVAIGGPTLTEEALRHELVDELRILRYPVAVGAGTRHLAHGAARLRLDLVESRVFEPAVVYERYRVIR